MQSKITKRTVDGTAPKQVGDLWVWDTEVKGFGLRVRPNGRKVYVVEYRPGQGGRSAPKRRYTIGQHGSPWTPDAARAEAIRVLGSVRSGGDPSVDRADSRRAGGDSVAALATVFIDKYAKRKQKSWRETERVFLKEVNPALGQKRVQDVSRGDVIRLLDQVAERGPIMANRTLAYVRRFFNWCVERGHLAESPCLGIKPPGKTRSRERALSDHELAEVWAAAEAIGGLWGPLVKTLLLTAQRRNEVAGMRWSEIDFDRKTWTIPGRRAKNKRAHEVPLTKAVFGTLTSLPRFEPKAGEGHPAPGDFVFTTTGRSPVSGFSKAKALIDRQILAARQAADPDAEPMPHWTFHDLRRTATTGMARLGVPPHIADAILNHKEGTIHGVAAVYNRYAYLEERRHALEAWEAQVLAAVAGRREVNQAG